MKDGAVFFRSLCLVMGNCKWRHHFFCRQRLPIVSWAPLESLTTKENAGSSAAIFLSNYTLALPLHSPEHYHRCLSSHFSSTLFSVQIFSASKCQHQNITLQDAHFSNKEDRIYNVNYFHKETSYLFQPTLYVYINPLHTKSSLLYLKTQSVPLCKHFSSRL